VTLRKKLNIGLAAAAALAGIAFVATPADATTKPKPFTFTTHTVLINRPDSGGGGNNWAKDNALRTLVITETARNATTGVYSFKATLTDVGTFTTVPGLTPNQGAPYTGMHELHVVTGKLSGYGTYTFTATRLPVIGNMPTHSSTPAPTGIETTSEWYKQAFPNGTVFDVGNPGIQDWIWTYTYNQTAQVGATTVNLPEFWVDSAADGGGQLPADGNIDGNKVVN
jgi:hypothetical protein